MKQKRLQTILMVLFIFSLLAVTSCTTLQETAPGESSVQLEHIGTYGGEPYVVLHGNVPNFTAENMATESYEIYSGLDSLGRCGAAMANIGQDLMPTEPRGSIGQIKPSGWQTVKYDIVDGKYLYNRCHLIGYQLSGENANEQNLITGTRYMNVEGMLPFENMVADYVQETGNHVLYRLHQFLLATICWLTVYSWRHCRWRMKALIFVSMYSFIMCSLVSILITLLVKAAWLLQRKRLSRLMGRYVAMSVLKFIIVLARPTMTAWLILKI